MPEDQRALIKIEKSYRERLNSQFLLLFFLCFRGPGNEFMEISSRLQGKGRNSIEPQRARPAFITGWTNNSQK